jgi:TonB-linked SusC/RagA family outer membrane protein
MNKKQYPGNRRLLTALFLLIVCFTCQRLMAGPAVFEQSGQKTDPTPSMQQPTNSIRGQITDLNHHGLAHVSVLEKGTQNGTVSDQNGDFTLQVASDTSILIFSAVGYTTLEKTAHNGMQVQMLLKNSMLDDVVVVGYGTQKKADLTGSIASVKSDQIASLPVPDAGQAIEGKAAGVQIVSSGTPGSNVTIRVRGTGTINNSDPLLVIDGVPTDVPLNTLNPDDIASIDILKDASASAIYGSRGANGVIMITTKKGQKGQSHLDLHAYRGVQKATYIVPLLDAAQFAQLNNEMLQNNNQATNPDYADPATLGTGTNWLDLMFRSAPIENYSLAYNVGSDKAQYYVSASYMNQQGIVINTAYKRYTLQFNSQAQVLPWLRFGNNLTLNHDQKPSGSYDIRSAMAANPALPLFNEDGSYSGPVGQAQWVGDVTNPIAKATLVQNNTKGYNLLGALYAELDLLKGLKFRTSGGLQAEFWDSRTWSPAYDYIPIPQPSSYLSQQSNKSITLNWDNYFTYDRTLGRDHHLNAVLGSNAQKNRYDFIGGHISGFPSDETQQLNNGTTQIGLNGSGSEWALASYYLRVNYAYQNKYLLTASVRRDGSSRFGDNHKWGTFPSLSLAWRLSKEPFMQTLAFIDDLKLRAGYGQTGNQNIGNYSFASTLNSAVYVFNGQVVPAELPLMMANPNVHWESVRQSNIGLDATLFNQRINLTLDAYIKNTTDMLVPMPVPIPTGYSDVIVPYINTGKVQNKGLEIAISTKNLTGPLKWNTDLNVSFNKNKVVALYDKTPLYIGSGLGLNGTLAIQKPGYPIGAFYGYVMQGIFQNQQEVDQAAVQVPGDDPYNRTAAGDVRFKDLNNDGVINDQDRTIIGDPNPQMIYSVNNTFSYKGIDLSIFLQGVQGNDIFNANNVYQQSMAVAQNQTRYTLGRWEGEGTSQTIPRAIFNDPNQNARISSRFLEDGSYLRIKNVTLGYNLPAHIYKKWKLRQVRIYGSIQNLLTFTKYTGFDPEVPASGVDFSVYPVTRTISLGLNVSL